MTLAVAEALNPTQPNKPNNPNPKLLGPEYRFIPVNGLSDQMCALRSRLFLKLVSSP